MMCVEHSCCEHVVLNQKDQGSHVALREGHRAAAAVCTLACTCCGILPGSSVLCLFEHSMRGIACAACMCSCMCAHACSELFLYNSQVLDIADC